MIFHDIPVMGEESILIFDNDKQACITKTKKVIITEFKNISEELSMLEGEGTFEVNDASCFLILLAFTSVSIGNKYSHII